MNFRPTPLKTSFSVVFGFLIDFLMAKNVKVICDCLAPPAVCDCPNHWTEFALDSGTLTVAFASMVIVYCVWSLIQKKNL